MVVNTTPSLTTVDPNHTRGNEVTPYNRRKSMSVNMNAIMDKKPIIEGLGIDCYHDVTDGTEIMNWTMKQAARLVGSSNAARRVAKVPKPYNGRSPWKEEYQNFLDDMECSGWDKEQSLPQLIAWLKDGPGKAAVEQWRQVYGANGTYDDLVASAAYLFGSLVAEDPMSVYWAREQKKDESPKVYGLELKGMLHKARPKLRYDDNEFIDDLFKRFCSGLRDSDHQHVAADAWKPGAALADLFIALDCFDKKKRMFAGLIVPRVSSMAQHEQLALPDSSESVIEPEDEDENLTVCYIQNGQFVTKSNYDKKKGFSKPKRPWLSDEEYAKKMAAQKQEKTSQLMTGTPSVFPKTGGGSSAVDNTPNNNRQHSGAQKPWQGRPWEGKPWADPNTMICKRCQQLGHVAWECLAEKPIPRYHGQKPPKISGVNDDSVEN